MSTILVVDDSPSIRLLLTRRLEMAGYSVTGAADSAGARRALESAPVDERPVLVLLDAMLPDTEGPEFLNQLKAARPDLPVLVVSAVSGLAGDRDWAAADGHVAKPIAFDDLLGRVASFTSGPPRP